MYFNLNYWLHYYFCPNFQLLILICVLRILDYWNWDLGLRIPNLKENEAAQIFLPGAVPGPHAQAEPGMFP